MAVCFSGLFAWRMTSSARLRASAADVAWSQEVLASTQQVAFHAQAAVAHCEPRYAASQANASLLQLARLEWAQDAVLSGSDVTGTQAGLQVSPFLFDLMVNDGCVDTGGEAYPLDVCQSAFYNGLVGRGLQAAMREYAQLTRARMTSRLVEVSPSSSSSSSSAPCVPDDLRSGAVENIRLFGEDYLAAGLAAAAAMRLHDAQSLLDGLQSREVGMAAGAVLALLAAYLALYSRTLAMLDRDVKAARRLLLLIPPGVATSSSAALELGAAAGRIEEGARGY